MQLPLVTYFLQPALERIKNTYCMGKRSFLYFYLVIRLSVYLGRNVGILP